MNMLQYNYHDAVIQKIEITETVFCFYLDLYPVYYPSCPTIKLCFEGITNFRVCNTWVEKLKGDFEDSDEPYYLGARMNAIEVRPDDAGLFFCKINCDSMELLKFKTASFNEENI